MWRERKESKSMFSQASFLGPRHRTILSPPLFKGNTCVHRHKQLRGGTLQSITFEKRQVSSGGHCTDWDIWWGAELEAGLDIAMNRRGCNHHRHHHPQTPCQVCRGLWGHRCRCFGRYSHFVRYIPPDPSTLNPESKTLDLST